MLEALPYNFGLCDRRSLTHFAECVVESWWHGWGDSSTLEALPYEFGL